MEASPIGQGIALVIFIGLVIVLIFGWRYFRWKGNELGVALTKSSPRTQKDWDLIMSSAERNAERVKKGISRFAAGVVSIIGIMLLWVGAALLHARLEFLASVGAFMVGSFITLMFVPPLISSIRNKLPLVDPKKTFSPTVIKLSVYLLFFPGILIEAYWFFVVRAGSSVSAGELVALIIFVYLIGVTGLWRALQRK